MTYQHDLDQYQRGRGYPEADDELLDLIERSYQGGSFMILSDKCGLFGQRLIDRQGVTTIGIEPDHDTVAAGMRAGVRMQSHSFELHEGLLHFRRLLEMYGTTGLIIRNVGKTLCGVDWSEFMTIIERSNVAEIFIEDGDIEKARNSFKPAFAMKAMTSNLTYLSKVVSSSDPAV